MSRQHILSLAAIFAFAVSPASAALIFNVGAGSLTATVYTDNATGNSQFDVRGAILTDVQQNGTDLGLTFIADTTGGTDPAFLGIPFGNVLLLALDGQTPSTGNFDTITYDFTTPLVIGNMLTFRANAAAAPAGSMADALLGSLIANGPLQFTFTFQSQVPVDASGLLSTFVLTGITAGDVPEPSTALMAVPVCLLLATVASGRRFRIS